MKNTSKALKTLAYIGITLIIVAVVIVRLKSNKTNTTTRVYQYDKNLAISVEADTIQIDSYENSYSYTGSFEPNKETKISAEVQGKINTILFDVGSIIKKGQAIIQLDNSILKLQLQTIEIQIEGLESDLKRNTILANADAIQGVQLEKAILGLKSAKVQKEILIEQIKKTTITSPFAGIITAKFNEEGAFAAPGIPLLQITDISLLKFTVNVSENELNQFTIDQNYSISADAYPEISLIGKVTMIGSKANVGNGFAVQLSVNNTSDLKIKSGMFGKVILKSDLPKQQILIPASAIVGTTIHPQVYLVKNGKAILQNINISERIQNKAVISSGLKEGDILVINGFINLSENANVVIKN